MGKAILVLNEKAISCKECELRVNYDDGFYHCPVLKEEIKNWKTYSPCPLKELPEKINQDEGDFKSGFWYQCSLGWNLCIDEILDWTED